MESEIPFAENLHPRIRLGWLGWTIWSILALVLLAFVLYVGRETYGAYTRLGEVRARNTLLDAETTAIQREIHEEELQLLQRLKERTALADLGFIQDSDNQELYLAALAFYYDDLQNEDPRWRQNAIASLKVLPYSGRNGRASQHRQICDHIMPLVHDPDPYVAWYALDTLRELRPESPEIAAELRLLATHPGHPLAAKAVAALREINPTIKLPVYARLRYGVGILPWQQYRRKVYFPDRSLEEDPEVKAILEKIEADEMRMYGPQRGLEP